MDTMQARIEQLEQENAALRALLKKHRITYPETTENQISSAAEQGSRILQNEVTPQMASFFYTYFRGRKDVYSVRSRPKDGKSGYFPVCTHFWDHKLCPKTTGQKIACRDCPNRAYKPLNIRALLAHLKGEREDGSDVVGIYPLLTDDTCYFLVFDFDDHEGTFQGSEKTASWRDEVDALRKICELEQIDALVERSRSGQGAHIWIFFSESVSAQKARQFGTALLTKGAEAVSLKSFRAYDRMLPLQEHLPEGKLGNLIALPLQGRALRNGNSAFVDENWNAYPDQWGALKSARKLSVKEIEDKIAAWTPEAGLLGQLAEEPQEAEENTQKSFLPEKPWRKTELTLHREDAEGTVEIVYANGVSIKSTNLRPRLQNQLRRLAAYKNPEFHKKLAMGFSTLGIPRIVYCGHDDGDFICLPRGCAERLKELLEEAAIPYRITDERRPGRKIEVSFAGQLYPEQQRAADALLAVSETDTLIVVAIGKYIGEGFNLPRLDTLLLAMPISWQGNVEQYAGRLNRDYDGKQDVIIFDYVDAHVPTLEHMYHKRLRAYRQIGFEICANLQAAQEEKTGTIFDAQTYTPVYERDLQAAQREILISSPALSRKKVTYFLELLRERQEAGVQIKILTLAPDAQDTYQAAEKIGFLRQSGIEVFPSQTCREHFAILDRCLVWYGSMNLLSNERPDDNLLRLPDEQIAQELLEIAVQADSASENKTG